MDWQANWIWLQQPVPTRNAFARFRRSFHWQGGAAIIHITADSRYVLYINGEYVGQGPVRSWPTHWKYDTYDLTPYLRHGENCIAVLVNHYGEGNFQYIPGPAGLLAQVEIAGQPPLATDTQWLAAPAPAYVSATPRISVQEGFEEQYDARLNDAWTVPQYAGTGNPNSHAWQPAVVVAKAGDPPHTALEPRDIPQLTLEPVQPARVVSAELVRSLPYRWRLEIKPYLHPTDNSSNHVLHHAYIYTQVYSPTATTLRLQRPHHHIGAIKLNGVSVANNTLPLQAGWNQLLVDYRGLTHLQAAVFAFAGPADLRFACRGAAGGAAWAILGPFGLTPDLVARLENDMDTSTVACQPLHAAATAEAGLRIWEIGQLDAQSLAAPYFQEMQPDHLPSDVFLQSYTDQPVAGPPQVDNIPALLSANHEWAVVHPSADGDVRLLFDFGREVVGFHRFEVDGAAGTILDWHNFEFIQPDGRHNFAEGMNNSLRYTLCTGRQTYQSYVRRGFQYSYLTIRNLHAPLRIRLVEVLFNSYPQAQQGSFASANAQLDRIWQVGAHSLRCCAEDTYVDCPTYEQTHWVGDARNEALVDWVINGDPRLWYRCLEQTGQSLERSPITESHVPSAWQNILPAWSFLWMRSCREYMLFTGDAARSHQLLEFIRRNVDGIKQHLNNQNLFAIRAWNMFDWARMDTPNQGVVTHQNCFAVLALRECVELARWLGANSDAADWEALAAAITQAINTHLWNDKRQAYTDCLHGTAQSTVFSQQTQTVALMSGVATGDRATVCRAYMHNPPDDFVKAGSPFFAFFLLEGLASEGRDSEFLTTILRDWGFMVDKGASTFWEMWSWSLPGGRLTRSHCHGWSAAPTYFLSTHVLGVAPLAPGFVRFQVAPHPGGLAWCRGTMPTPQGIINVQWEDKPGEPFQLCVNAPAGLTAEITPPRYPANVVYNGESQYYAAGKD